MKGIDVSKWQSFINWAAVKASGIEFAILRAGYGKEISQTDLRFEDNYARATAQGIPVGAYWFSYATTVEEAKQEARVFLQVIKGKRFEMPVYFDLEDHRSLATGKANCSAMIRAFCGVLEDAGYWAGLYMSRSTFMSHTDESIRTRYALWLAEWNKKLNYSDPVGIWQYSDKGRVAGITGDVDLDECYIDYPKMIKNGGFNGFQKPDPLPYTPGMTPTDVARIPYIAGMTAADVQTYIRWVTCKGAGDYQDTAEDFAEFLKTM